VEPSGDSHQETSTNA